MAGERTLLRLYIDSQDRICYDDLTASMERKDLSELIVMTKILYNNLLECYQDVFLEHKVIEEGRSSKIRELLDRKDIPDINEGELE